MTAEITIMNRQAVALAADSAVTVGRRRVWKTANKLFSMAPYNDVAIMAYGAGDFSGLPWETIIKTFRSKIKQNRYDYVSDLAKDLMEYLKNFTKIEESEEKASILMLFVRLFDRMSGNIGECNSATEFKKKIDAKIRSEHEAAARNKSWNSNIDKSEFKLRYEGPIQDLAKEAFKGYITKKLHTQILNLCYDVFSCQIRSGYHTGIVIAGFGVKENFPSQEVYIIDGKHNSVLRHWRGVNCQNLNEVGATGAAITPHGQSDIAVLFLEGVARQHLQWMRRSLKLLLDDKSDNLIKAYVGDEDERTVEAAMQRRENSKTVRELERKFDKYRDKSLVQPVMDVLSTLPKEEMADMAEALVELTSLRRRVDSPLESVGGPIDVAVISKGDGLVWIKRKHYFDGALNADFRDRKRLQWED